MRKLYLLFVSILSISASASYTWAGAWSMNKGGLYAKYPATIIIPTILLRRWRNERLPSGTTFTDNNTTLYLEYGITNRLTISGSLPYKWLRSTYRQVTVGNKTKTQSGNPLERVRRHGTGAEILLLHGADGLLGAVSI